MFIYSIVWSAWYMNTRLVVMFSILEHVRLLNSLVHDYHCNVMIRHVKLSFIMRFSWWQGLMGEWEVKHIWKYVYKSLLLQSVVKQSSRELVIHFNISLFSSRTGCKLETRGRVTAYFLFFYIYLYMSLSSFYRFPSLASFSLVSHIFLGFTVAIWRYLAILG